MFQWSDKQQQVPIAMEIQNPGLEALLQLLSFRPAPEWLWLKYMGGERQDKTKGDAIYLGISVDFTSHSQQLLILPRGPRLSMLISC